MSFLVETFIHELDIFLGFSWRDWSTTLIPGSLWALGALHKLPPVEALRSYLLVASWLTLFIYFFNLSNQIAGVEEDAVNKPDRPIPSGKVTMVGAKWRWVVVFLTFFSISSYHPTLLPATICWIAITVFVDFTDIGGHWFWKNTFSLGIGTWALLQGSWNAVSPTVPRVEGYILGVSVWNALVLHISDLRDVKGDIVVRRKTFPIVFGDHSSRRIISFVFLPMAMLSLYLSGIMRLAPVTLSVSHAILAYRVLRTDGPRYDHKTYMFLTYIFCLILAFTAMEGMNPKVLRFIKLFPVFY